MTRSLGLGRCHVFVVYLTLDKKTDRRVWTTTHLLPNHSQQVRSTDQTSHYTLQNKGEHSTFEVGQAIIWQTMDLINGTFARRGYVWAYRIRRASDCTRWGLMYTADT